MRHFIFAMLVGCVSLVGHAAGEGEHVSLIDAAGNGADVVITPVPVLVSNNELAKPVNTLSKMRVAKKARIAKKQDFPGKLLTRSEKRQREIFVASAHKPGAPLPIRYYHRDENGQPGYDDLPLHSFYSRPRLTDEPRDRDVDGVALSGGVKLRLMMARLKAVESHVLSGVVDDGEPLPSAVQSRLATARERALAAHAGRYGLTA